MSTAPSVEPTAALRNLPRAWIWFALGLVAVLGAWHAFVVWSGLPGFAVFLLVGSLCAPFVLARLCWVGLIIPLTVGIRCPGCARRPLTCVTCVSFSYHYYRCDHCGQRHKRQSFDEPWEDANSAGDLPFFQPKPKFALSTRQEWVWAGLFVGVLLLWLAPGAVGYAVAGVPGCVVGSALGFWLLTVIPGNLARRKEAAHRQQWRDAVDGLA